LGFCKNETFVLNKYLKNNVLLHIDNKNDKAKKTGDSRHETSCFFDLQILIQSINAKSIIE